MREGDRHEAARRANVETVFAAIAEHAPVSRTSLVGVTGLSKPTVLRLVAALESEGLIRRVGAAVRPEPRSEPRAGRTPARYEPNPEAAHVIGVDVGGTKIAVGLAALTGPPLARSEAATATHGADALLGQVVGMVRDLRGTLGAGARVGAVSVGLPGVQNHDGTIDLAGNLPGLSSVEVAAELSRALGLPVEIENDVNLAALGELEAGVARACRTFALLSLGTGAGLGLVINRQLARGARGAAGEVAYLPIGVDPASPVARHRGAFEVAAAGSGVTALVADELARAATRVAARSPLTPTSTAREAYAAAGAGDPLACRVVARHADLVARAILSISCLVDPELVVLGGGIGANPLLREPVVEALGRIVPWPVRVESSSLGQSAGVIGALHHARRMVPRLEAARVSARFQRLGLDGPGGPG